MKNDEIALDSEGEGPRGLRWLLIILGAAAAALLAASLETGRLHAAVAGFSFRGALARIITPGVRDGRNDVAVLCFENPKDSSVSGTVYDMRGQSVSGMAHLKEQGDPTVSQCRAKYPPAISPPQLEAMTWDGRSDGALASGGVYIYQLQSEDVSVTGTLLVVR
jgi:hypothetical protein